MRNLPKESSHLKPLDLAKRYIKVFFEDESPDELQQICHPKMRFEGPFFQFDSTKDYIESLKKDPPRGMNYHLLYSYKDKNSACLFYRFTKGKISVPMAQRFEVRNGKISRILLIFDGRAFLDNTRRT